MGYEDGEAVIRKFNEKEGIGGSKFFLCRDYQYISLNESGHCDPVLTIMGPVAQFFPSKEKPRKNAYNVLVHGFNGTFRISSDLISIAILEPSKIPIDLSRACPLSEEVPIGSIVGTRRTFIQS